MQHASFHFNTQGKPITNVPTLIVKTCNHGVQHRHQMMVTIQKTNGEYVMKTVLVAVSNCVKIIDMFVFGFQLQDNEINHFDGIVQVYHPQNRKSYVAQSKAFLKSALVYVLTQLEIIKEEAQRQNHCVVTTKVL